MTRVFSCDHIRAYIRACAEMEYRLANSGSALEQPRREKTLSGNTILL
jgi:hypothetical protein